MYGYGPPRPPDRGPLRTLRRRRPVAPRVQRTISAPAPSVVQNAAQPPQPPSIAEQAMALMKQQIDPVLQQITGHYNQEAQDTSSYIGNATNSYANTLSELAKNVPSVYQHGIRTVRNTATGLNKQLTGLGMSTAHAQNMAAYQAGIPTDAGGKDINLGQLGIGAGSTAGAIGQAMLDALKAEQDAAEGYAKQLPGFAQLEGQQNTRDALSVIAKRLAEDLSSATAAAPSTLYSIYQDMLDRQNQDRSYNESVRQYNQDRQDRLNEKRASIGGPGAPTNAGRLAYWQDQAKQRSDDTGDIWVGTTTGIRPYDADPRKPGIQRQRTSKGQASDYLNEGRQASAAATVTRAQTGVTNAQTARDRARETARHNRQSERTAQQRADQATERENNRHSEAISRIATAQKNARTAAARAAAQRARDAETRRHHRATEAISRSKKKPAASGGNTRRPWTN